jgi:PAS domain S-box-containing protein
MSKPLRVLIVEDSEDDSLLMLRELKRGGYDPVHDRVETAKAMKAALKEQTWDLILCDYVMPHFSAPDALKTLKESGLDIPFIIVSGSIGEDTAVAAMKAGAHDYMMKNNLKRLVPAIEHEIREANIRRKLKVSEESLQKSEEKYRLLVENANEAIFVIQDGMLRFFNIKNIELIGYSKEELTSAPYINFVHPDDRQTVFERYLKRIKGEEPPGVNVFRIVDKAGNIRWAEVNSVLISWEGRPATLNFLNNITERKQTEEALRESEKKYRTLVTQSPDGIFIVDLQGTFLAVNIAMCERLKYSEEEFLSMKIWDIVPEKYVDLHKKRIADILRGEAPNEAAEYVVRGKDEKMHYIEVLSNPYFRENEVIGFQGIARDITERKQAEEALRTSQERFRQLFDEAPIGYHEVDSEGRITRVNRTESEMLGYTVEEMLGQPAWNFIVEEEESRKAVAAKLAGVVLPFKGLERTYRRKDGTTFPVSIEDLLLRDSEGRTIGIRSTVQDITERKRAEQEMVTLQEQLRQSQKMEAIGQLAGGIAHDFNNLLTIIKGYSQLSLMGLKEGNALKVNIEQIEKAANRAAELTSRILAFSRHQMMEMKVLNLNTIVKNLNEMLHRMIGENIELMTHLREDLRRVKTDHGQIEQVIMNLAVNAKDAMPHGGKLTIETANVDLDEEYARNHVAVTPGRYVMLAVSDTGVGMTPEIKEKVFEPFFTTKKKGEGTGLGLSTVYGIVKQSSGNIWVYSEPGKGTTFKIYLPCVDEPLDEIRKEGVVREGLPRGSETILVVEDEEVVRKLTVRILQEQGYRVLEGGQGTDAFPIADEHEGQIHLLLTDVVMPKMSGKELAGRIASLRPGIKVLYMSGYTDNAIAHHGIFDKGINFIQKPFTVDGLVRKVREVLDK